jgi:hypothetical protein
MRWLIPASLLWIGLSWGQTPDTPKDAPKGTVVDLDGLKATTPADWTSEKPANRLRSHQFKIPKAKDDKIDAELTILPDTKGTVEQNVTRWKESFAPPPGKKIDEVSRLEKFKVGAIEVVYFDVTGTFIYRDRPVNPTVSEARPDYRMIAVLFETKENLHTIRLVGPAKTIAAQQKAFDGWLKSFK